MRANDTTCPVIGGGLIGGRLAAAGRDDSCCSHYLAACLFALTERRQNPHGSTCPVLIYGRIRVAIRSAAELG